MDNINNKYKRVFIPQKIGDAVQKINRVFISRFGKIEFIIHSNWANIVGPYFKDFSEPKQITQLPNFENE